MVVFTDDTVGRGVKSGWAYSARPNGVVVAEGTGAVCSDYLEHVYGGESYTI